MKFLLEKHMTFGQEYFTTEVSVFLESLSQLVWWQKNESIYEVDSKFLEELNKENTCGVIPVGSVGFVNRVLSMQGYKMMKPINVPKELWSTYFTSRRIAVCKSKQDIFLVASEWNEHTLFIKSNTRLKCNYTDVYDISRYEDALINKLPEDEYFVSENVEFESEWRVFVHRGEIVGIKNYCGEPVITPNMEFINVCIRLIGVSSRLSLSAYTLDVGILTNGATAVVEVHPFAACGLYGFESMKIVQMTIDAYRWLTSEAI